MGSTSLLFSMACLLTPVQQDATATDDQMRREQTPAILHVARDAPQLQSLAPIRSDIRGEKNVIADEAAEFQPASANGRQSAHRSVPEMPEQETRQESEGLLLNPSARPDAQSTKISAGTTPGPVVWRGHVDDTKRPPRPMTVQTDSKNPPPTRSQSTSRTAAADPSSANVEVPEVLRVRPRETAQPAPPAVSQPQSSSASSQWTNRDHKLNRPAEPTRVAARNTRNSEASGITPPRRLFDTSPIGSGVRRIPHQRSNEERLARADRFRVQRENRSVPSTNSAVQSAPRLRSQEAEVVAEPLQIAMAGPRSFAVGQDVDFQVVITNLSDQAIDEALVQLTPSVGFRVTVLDRAAAMDQSSGIVQWRVADLQPGGQEVIRFKAESKRVGKMVHSLQVVGRDGKQATTRVSTVAVIARRSR